MKIDSIRLTLPLTAAVLGAALLIPASQGIARAEGQDVTVTVSKLDITHGVGAEPVDQYDMTTNFNNTEKSESAKCDTADSPVNGFTMTLQEGACGAAGTAVTETVPALHKIGAGKYKFEGVTPEGATVDATLTKLVTPKGSCGKWHLVFDVSPADLSTIHNNPVATAVTLADGSTGCLEASARIDQ